MTKASSDDTDATLSYPVRMVDPMAGARKHRRILLAELDGATRRGEVIGRSGDADAIASHRRRIDSLRAEIAAHDEIHGPPVAEGSGGLWGTTGPAQRGDRLYSSGPTLDNDGAARATSIAADGAAGA